MMSYKKWWTQIACGAVFCATGAVAVDAAPPRWADWAPAMRTAGMRLTGAPAKPRWIGVACEPVSDDLRANIDVPEGQGLLVRQVVPGSPAEKAGLAEHDVVFEVNGQPVSSLETLIQAVSQAGDDGIELKWLHRGHARSARVQPVARPGQSEPVRRGPMDFMKRFRWRDGDFTAPFQMRFFGPTIEFPPPMGKDFPEDLKVKIEKHGSQPAQVTVEKGDQRWEVTEDDLDSLPKDVRPFVQRFLGRDFLIRVPGTDHAAPLPKWDGPGPQPDIEFFQRPETRQFFRRFAPFDIEKRLNHIDQRMDQLHKAIKQLRGGKDHSQDSDAKADEGEPTDKGSDATHEEQDSPDVNI